MKMIDIVHTIMSIVALIIIAHYLFLQYEKYYMISFFMLPFILKIITNLTKGEASQIINGQKLIDFIVIFYVITAYLLSLLIPEVNSFFIKADKFLFPFFYYKEVKFSYLIVVCWMLLGLIKNNLLSLLLSIAVFIGWLLVYNLW